VGGDEGGDPVAENRTHERRADGTVVFLASPGEQVAHVVQQPGHLELEIIRVSAAKSGRTLEAVVEDGQAG
jgi:hypothetical protein